MTPKNIFIYLRNHQISLCLFVLIISLLYSATIGVFEFSDQPVTDFYSFFKTAGLWILVAYATSGVLAIMSTWRIIFAITFPILMSISSILCFLFISIGSRLTESSIEIALENDAEMWLTVITPGLICAMLLGLGLGVVISMVRWTGVKAYKKNQILLLIYGLATITIVMAISPKIRWTVGNRLPYSLYCCTSDYIENRKEAKTIRTTYDNTPVERAINAPDVIFVIGESLRADHLPMNGYDRNTMPLLSTDTLLINFSDLYSEFTNTNVSVPALLTRYSPKDPDASFSEQSFITLYKNAGYNTAWFANQNLTRYYSYFANEADTLIYCNDGKSIFHYDQSLDTDILLPFKEWYDKKDAEPRLAVIHTIGSHWWYPTHYTKEDAQFIPVVKHKEIAALNHDEIVNSYDNTIIATDRFLHQLKQLVAERNAVIFYISDHGELLGEDGRYLHDGAQPPLHLPASLVLYTTTYGQNFPVVIDSLRNSSSKRVDSKMTFHTVLRLGHLSTPVLNNDSTFLNPAGEP